MLESPQQFIRKTTAFNPFEFFQDNESTYLSERQIIEEKNPCMDKNITKTHTVIKHIQK
jgi:hypothetical protein